MNNESAVIGIDIGGTKVSAALFGADGQIIFREKEQLSGKRGRQVADQVIELARNLMQAASESSYRVRGIGTCIPGIYHPTRKKVWAPNIPGWYDYPLYDDLLQAVQDTSVSILIESDRSCYILGEVWKGIAQGCKDAIFMAVGTGIGAGILCNGNIITGNSGIAGAIGWMALEPPYREKYKTCGNFEYYASGAGIARSAIEVLERTARHRSRLGKLSADTLSSYDVFAAYEKNDAVAVEVIEKAVLYWGMVVANLVSIFNPEKVIFGGGVFGPAEKFIDRILLESKKWAQPISMDEVSLEVSVLKGDAGLIGAGYLALKSLKNADNVH